MNRLTIYLLFISLLCSLCVNAQKDYSKEIEHVLEKHDLKVGEKLIQKMKQEDIALLDSSSLTDYYYLKAFVESENGKKETAIVDLLKVKDLLETKIGIYENIYMYIEILKALGEISEDCGKDDEALLYYEEGIIKAFPFMKSQNETLQDYIASIRSNASALYQKKGHEDMAQFIAMEKFIDYEGSMDHGNDLLSQALQLKNEGKAEQAISLLNKAKDIFGRGDKEGKEMMQPLYRTYLLCYASIGDENNIDKLLRTKKQLIFYDDKKSYLALDMGETIASFLLTHHNIKAATKYYNFLIREHDKSNPEDVAKIEEYGNTLSFFEKEFSLIDSLSQKRKSFPENNYDWGITSLQLANEYMRIHDFSKGNDICQEIYSMSSKLANDTLGLHNGVLQNLADYNMQESMDFKLAERYLNEQLLYYDKYNIPQDNEVRGWVYNKLAIVYMRTEQYSQGEETIAKAENILVPIYTKESETYSTLLHNRGRLAQLQGDLELARQLFIQSNELRKRIVGTSLERTMQYLNEVEQAIKEKL